MKSFISKLVVAIILQVLGVCFLAQPFSIAGDYKFLPTGSLHVYDSMNRKVGDVITVSTLSYGPYAMVSFNISRIPVVVGVLKTHFVGNVGYLYFNSNDCSGSPLFWLWSAPVALNNESVLPPTSIFYPGNTVYIPDLSATPETMDVSSVWDDFYRQCRDIGKNTFDGLVPTIPLVDLTKRFIPPFRVGFDWPW